MRDLPQVAQGWNQSAYLKAHSPAEAGAPQRVGHTAFPVEPLLRGQTAFQALSGGLQTTQRSLPYSTIRVVGALT